jgi:hypothetical protein
MNKSALFVALLVATVALICTPDSSVLIFSLLSAFETIFMYVGPNLVV